MQQKLEEWGKRGFQAITLIAQDGVGEPATAETAKKWAEDYELTFPVAAVELDPILERYWPDCTGFPCFMALEPGMKVVYENTRPIDFDAVLEAAGDVLPN